MALTLHEARQLMNRGYEIGARVMEGQLQRSAEGGWLIGDVPLEEWLESVVGQQVVVVAVEVEPGGGEKRVCPVCGIRFAGHQCPRCGEARRRLRG
ncbi:MAG: hypothetical protein JW934_06480 [Anaerolineae bacterium]|nr:hypothetical protein [Anaerolineae bacterium]